MLVLSGPALAADSCYLIPPPGALVGSLTMVYHVPTGHSECTGDLDPQHKLCSWVADPSPVVMTCVRPDGSTYLYPRTDPQ